MKIFKVNYQIFFLFCILQFFLLISCGKKEDNTSTSTSTSSAASCSSSRTLTASTKVPLLVVRVQYANATFNSDETTWANKLFGTSEGQLNHFMDETTYGNYQFTPVSETSGCANDGIVTVSLSKNHPNTQNNSWGCDASSAISAADTYVNFAAYDTNSSDNLSVGEMQVMFLVAGGESASGINSPGGVWAAATNLYCDADGDGSVRVEEGEYWMTLDSVNLLGSISSNYDQNGYSLFGERQGSSSSNTWDATIGVIAHELGHSYFKLPDLYATSGSSEGIGNFGLMGGGSWGQKSVNEKAGATPVHFSAWSKEQIGACVPQTVSSGTNNVTLPAVYQSSVHASSCGIYKATTSNSDEYFLFENRSPGGYEEGFAMKIYYGLNACGGEDCVPGSVDYLPGGVAIWHVKNILHNCWNLDNASGYNKCQTQSPKLLDLEEANNGDLDNGSSSGRTTHLFYSGNNATFDSDSTPNSKLYNNSASGISVTNISAGGNNMTLTISK